MKLLLDTHILLWSLLGPERLPGPVAHALTAEGNELWLSPITSWECLVLAHKGRIRLEPDPERWLRRQLAHLGPTEAPITHEVAIRSRALDIGYEDPADRFLAATAQVYDLTLVTVDERLIRANVCRLLESR
jgi:PIN domain nuclease of toxin-antitoxin system